MGGRSLRASRGFEGRHAEGSVAVEGSEQSSRLRAVFPRLMVFPLRHALHVFVRLTLHHFKRVARVGAVCIFCVVFFFPERLDRE